MRWILTAVVLVAWVAGLVLRLGSWVHLLLVAAAALLVYQLVADNRDGGRG